MMFKLDDVSTMTTLVLHERYLSLHSASHIAHSDISKEKEESVANAGVQRDTRTTRPLNCRQSGRIAFIHTTEVSEYLR